MVIVDFNKKKEDITEDYYSTIGGFDNVSVLLSQKEWEVTEHDDDETKKIKEGRQRDILVALGKIAEMAFKYIIKIRRMELFPNEPYLDTNINGNIVKGFRDKEKLPAGVIRDFGNRVHASTSDIDSILNVAGVGPKAHDFNYLYLIIEKLMPDVYDNLKTFMEIKIKSENIAKIFKEEEIEYPIFTVFPNDSLKTKKEEDDEEKQIRALIAKRNSTIVYSGDIFTRLRYYSNNPFDKNFNIEEIYDVVANIISFIKVIHLYDENLDFNPEIAFSYYKLKNNPSLSKFNKEEITKIYSHNKIKTNCDHIMDSIFYSNDMTFDEIMEIINCDDIPEDSYLCIFTNELTLEKILYFRSIGIDDYEAMASELKNSPFKSYSLEEYKKLREELEADKYPNILVLIDFLSKESINKLKQYPEVLTFFIDEFHSNINLRSHKYADALFNILLSIKEVRENNNCWYGLDIDQIDIYYNIYELLLKDPLNDEIINKRNFYVDTVIENIKENIEFFKNDPKMLCVMPLMLDCEDNQKILNILIRNGLDINDLRGFDSTILCFPVKLVEVIEKLLVDNDIPLIIDNKVNPFIINIINMISDNFKSKIDIKTRRIPFYKSMLYDDYNPTDNPIINELSCEEDCQLDTSSEMSKLLEEFENKIKKITKEQLTEVYSTHK